MPAIDYLRHQGFHIRVCGQRLVVSPASKLKDIHRQYIRLHRLELLAEAAAGDGETRRSSWNVVIPGYGIRRMVGEPCTRAEALRYARGIWPGADIQEAP